MSWLPWLLLGFIAGDFFSSLHDQSELERDDERRRWEYDFGDEDFEEIKSERRLGEHEE